MSRSELSLNLTRPGGAVASRLWIEQAEYGITDGRLSRAGMYRAIFAILDDEEVPQPECVPDCGTSVFVYRDNLSLPYQLHTSHGELGHRVVEDFLYTEKIQFSMQDSVGLKYPNFGGVSFNWLGGRVWGQDGMEIPAPPLSATRNEVKAGQKLYGTLEVTYRVVRDRYSLALPRREEAEADQYGAVVYAIHRGGPTWEHIEPPPGAEDTGQQCTGGGGGGGVDITPPDDPYDPPTSPHSDARKIWDYCSQEVIRDDTV